MSTEYEQSGNHAPQKSSESFMEPRTIPKQWDVSAFDTDSTPSRNRNVDRPAEPPGPDATNTVGDDGPDSRFDPFPKPRTIPGNWDVSDMV